MNILLSVFLISFAITFFSMPVLIRKLKERGIVGRDMHKQNRPMVPDTAGVSIAAGIVFSVLLVVGYSMFAQTGTDIISLLAAVLSILIIEMIGFYDDLFKIRQSVKAVIPIFAAIPLMAIVAGTTTMNIPFIGVIDFGVLYVIAFIPLGVTVASNLTNMLAGFNGAEAGMGIVMFTVMSILFFVHGKLEPLIITIAMLGSLFAFIRYNWYPAKIFPGDATTFLIGGTLATVVILGNMETAGALLVIPHVIDFFIKAVNKFPSSGWWGEYKMGKLYCPKHGPVGFCQLVLKTFNGLTEVQLTSILIGIEAVFGIIVLILYI